MQLRTLGPSGLQVTVMGLGCNNFGMRIDQEASAKVVQACLDAGVTFFDTSDSYGSGKSEEFLGAALGSHRDDVVIATKFTSRMGDGPYRVGASRKHLIAACEDSLRRLGTDYIDLYYQHRPDPDTPVAETLGALDDLVRAGKVRYIASSNFAGWQIADAEWTARSSGRTRYIASQSEWSLLKRKIEVDVVPACEEYGISVVPYFPLASGLLTGKYKKGVPAPEGSRLAAPAWATRPVPEHSYETIDRLSAVGQSIGHSLLEIAIGWIAHQPVVGSVLVGATKPEQVVANAAAAEVSLTSEELQQISDATRAPSE